MPELKTFDIVTFSLAVYEHRVGMKMSRRDYAEALGLGSTCPIHHIEIRKVAEPSLTVAMNICKWMGKDIKEYFV